MSSSGLQEPGQPQPNHTRLATIRPTPGGLRHCPPTRCASKSLTPVNVSWHAEQCAEANPVHHRSQPPHVMALADDSRRGGVI